MSQCCRCRSRRAVLFGVPALALLAACGADPNAVRPPEIAYGRDTCDQCGMVISEGKYACALQLEDGSYRKFDDIGDLAQHQLEHPELRIRARFVHDFISEKWIAAETAAYVHSRTLATPMGHGLAAFEKKADAEAAAKLWHGDVLTFDGVRVLPIKIQHAA